MRKRIDAQANVGKKETSLDTSTKREQVATGPTLQEKRTEKEKHQ